ncbi:microsomal glutathione S-transferase 1-like isoform X1 [Montipora foliosa]|uniref:microsomal glutathione S-transferase 1-like isoform X1 n=1 Tax=Montipora foliosa TaxID=591990 RepID=UPI0035F20B9A
MVTLTVDSQLLAAYVFYGTILLLKTSALAVMTGMLRIKNKAFLNPEDYGPKDKFVARDEEVERFRRTHQNDLENIPIFLIVALFYMLLNLSPVRGIWCLRVFTAARVAHSIAYLSEIAVARSLSFTIGLSCTLVLAFSSMYTGGFYF